MSKKKVNLTASNTKSKVLLLGTVGLVLGGLVVATYNVPSQNAVTKGQFGSTMYSSSLTATANSCGETFRFKTNESLYGEIPQEFYAKPNDDNTFNIPKHPMIVPVYGYMSSRPLSAEQVRFYADDEDYQEVPIQVVLRTMWDYDTKVIWYGDKATSGDIYNIEQYVKTHSNVLALPWKSETPIPLQRNIAFSSWGISQSCGTWDETVFNEFTKFAEDNPVKHEDTPPVSKLSKYGKLYPIDPGRSYEDQGS